MLKRLYHLGIRPAWWKLEAQSAEAWREIAAVIAANDPLCHGVLLLGLDAARSRSPAPSRSRRRYPVCRGFAIGRTIFGQAARDWLAGSLDDQAAIARVAAGYARVIDQWRRLRPRAAAA